MVSATATDEVSLLYALALAGNIKDPGYDYRRARKDLHGGSVASVTVSVYIAILVIHHRRTGMRATVVGVRDCAGSAADQVL